MDTGKYMALFISESQEHLQSMNDSLIRIEQNHDDAEALNEAFRNAHSIKGMAASMGLTDIRDLAHAVENLMDDFRQGVRQPGTEAMDLLFRSLDRLEACVKKAAQNEELSPEAESLTKLIQSFRQAPASPEPVSPETEAPPEDQIADEISELPGVDMAKYKAMFISESQEHLNLLTNNLDRLEQNPEDQDAIKEIFRNAHSIKGMAASMRFIPIRDLAQAAESLLDEFRERPLPLDPESREMVASAHKQLSLMLEDLANDRPSPPEAKVLTEKINGFFKTRFAESAFETASPAEPEPAPKQREIELDFDPEPLKPRLRPPPEPKEEIEAGDRRPPVSRQSGGAVPFEQPNSGAASATAEPIPSAGPGIEVDFDSPLPRAGVRSHPPRGQQARRPQPPAPTMTRSDISPEPTLGSPEIISESVSAPEPEAPSRVDARPAVRAEPPTAAHPRPVPNHLVKVVFAADTAAPAVRGLILFKRLSEVGEIIDSRPKMEAVKSGSFLSHANGLAVEIDLYSETAEAEIIKVVNSLADVASFEIKNPTPVLGQEAKPAEPASSPEHEPGAAVVTEQGRIEPVYDPFAQVQGLPQTVRVKTTALDRFIGALGEMIMVKSELREVAKRNPLPALENGLERLETLIKDFNDQVMSIRMMPLESVVQRLPRVVRDLAREEGKLVKFEVKGRDIELDRAILEQLTDPLIHLLRNCVSHGVEPPAEREKNKKPREGKIEIEAYRLRDLVLIEVRDDGGGMDPFLLKETAVAKGLISADEANQMADEDAVNLIFTPGFSTAREVGMISGRGVGMDAVKNVTESVGGYVTVASVTGRGTTFTLHLPRTIAIVNVLLVRVAREVFGIPIAKVLKTVEILPHQIRNSQNKLFYLDRQELVPMKTLHRFLDLPESEANGRDPIPALIVEAHKRKVALKVDELLGQEEAFIRPLGKPLEKISGLSGVTMLGDGRVVFVLDTMTLI